MVTAAAAVAQLDAFADKSAAFRVAAMQSILDEDRAEVRAALESLRLDLGAAGFPDDYWVPHVDAILELLR